MEFDAFTFAVIEYLNGTPLKNTVLPQMDSLSGGQLLRSILFWREPGRLSLVLDPPRPEPEENQDVHTEHCCYNCGCKYGREDECSVESGAKRQSFACGGPCD